jgi:hypothetical protein
MDTSDIIKEGLAKYKMGIQAPLKGEMESLFGGPRNWPEGISPPDEDSENQLISVWNEAIFRCLELVDKM